MRNKENTPKTGICQPPSPIFLIFTAEDARIFTDFLVFELKGVILVILYRERCTFRVRLISDYDIHGTVRFYCSQQ